MPGFRISGPEVELSFPFLIEHAIFSGAAATDVHPVGWHHYDRSWA